MNSFKKKKKWTLYSTSEQHYCSSTTQTRSGRLCQSPSRRTTTRRAWQREEARLARSSSVLWACRWGLASKAGERAEETGGRSCENHDSAAEQSLKTGHLGRVSDSKSCVQPWTKTPLCRAEPARTSPQPVPEPGQRADPARSVLTGLEARCVCVLLRPVQLPAQSSPHLGGARVGSGTPLLRRGPPSKNTVSWGSLRRQLHITQRKTLKCLNSTFLNINVSKRSRELTADRCYFRWLSEDQRRSDKGHSGWIRCFPRAALPMSAPALPPQSSLLHRTGSSANQLENHIQVFQTPFSLFHNKHRVGSCERGKL